jgi:hypothetical protein
MLSGFFLRKKPLDSVGFGVQQLENRYRKNVTDALARLGGYRELDSARRPHGCREAGGCGSNCRPDIEPSWLVTGLSSFVEQAAIAV